MLFSYLLEHIGIKDIDHLILEGMTRSQSFDLQFSQASWITLQEILNFFIKKFSICSLLFNKGLFGLYVNITKFTFTSKANKQQQHLDVIN